MCIRDSTKPSLSLQEYAGKYSNKGYGTLEVKYNGSNLIADYNSTQLNLKHKHFDLFVGYPQEDAENGTELFFQLNKMGKVEKVLIPLQPGLKDIEFTLSLIHI